MGQRKAARQVYRVQAIKRGREGWKIVCPDGTSAPLSTKAPAVRMARRWAKRNWVEKGIPTQLVIYRFDGKIQTEYTYGRDPEITRG